VLAVASHDVDSAKASLAQKNAKKERARKATKNKARKKSKNAAKSRKKNRK
jgi:hypothetical protein